MKKFSLIKVLTELSLYCILLSALLSCDKSENIEGKRLSVTPDMLEFEATAGTKLLDLRTDAGEWSLTQSDNTAWCTPASTSGKGSTSLSVSVSANESSERSTILTFTAPGCDPVEVKVVQEGSAPEIKYGVFSEPEIPDADQPCTLYFRADEKSELYNTTDDLYAHIGINSEWQYVVAEWNTNIDKCKWTPAKEKNLWTLEITPSIREYFGSGTTEISCISVVVRNASGTKQSRPDSFLSVNDSKYAFVPEEVVIETLPSDALPGINYNSDGSVTLVLLEKDKKGERYDHCYVVGDFNEWNRSNDYAMKRDETAGCWWITLENLQSGKEYMYQYYLMKGTDRVRISDPYSEIIYDGDNDKYISPSTYPNLPEYPKGAVGLVSAFEIGGNEYIWKVNDFEIKDKDDMVIYELHLRDFSQSGDLAGAKEKLGYLEDLGINAIELMPVQEFDGNDSWGYNPSSYFALDKAYGTRDAYKEFIDLCHKQGIAVILDVVYNHATGAHPMAKLYWDAATNNTSSNNPWFNVQAPHPYSVYHDWNHENKEVKEHIKRSLGYLLEEYRFDGFRFDLTKGFTQKTSNESSSSNYDKSRIDILTEYYNAINKVNPDAVVILEHFCDDKEEKELAQAGMKVWRNSNYAYCQTAMGYKEDSDFGGIWSGRNSMKFGGYVGFMESHDEERMAYKQSAYGVAEVKGKLDVMMNRCALNAAFFLTVPGPKMIWQFGEMGYDVSIDYNGRTGRKPLHWEYLDNENRKELHDTYMNLLSFRKENPEFFDEGAKFSWNTAVTDWSSGRYITCTAADKAFVVIGNFDTKENSLNVKLPVAGEWKKFEKVGAGVEESYSQDGVTVKIPAGEFVLLIKE